MKGLMAAVIGMGILIVAGVTVIVVVMVGRMSSLSPSDARTEAVTLEEPDGTHIVGSAFSSDRVAVQLSGGGRPDRLVIVDTRSGRVIGRIALAR